VGEPRGAELPGPRDAVTAHRSAPSTGSGEGATAVAATASGRDADGRPTGGRVATAGPRATELLTRRAVVAAPLIGIATLIAGLIATNHAGVSFRDTNHVAAKYVVLVGTALIVLVAIDVAIRAAAVTGTRRPTREAMRAVRQERWGPYRGFAAFAGLLGFYLAYLSYGNIKSVVPLLRPDVSYDRQFQDIDEWLFFGHDPADLVHSLLGSGLQTHVLSAFYVAFIVFLPLSLALSLVFAKNLRGGLFIATALSANWLIGAGTYVALPAMGPIYAFASDFAHLPATAVTTLQSGLLDDRVAFLARPTDPSTGQAIAAFVSLHTSMTVTAALSAHLLGFGRRLKIALWAVVAITVVDTVYLGWHYVVDDFGGVAVALCALLVARLLTGIDLKGARRAAAAERAERASSSPAGADADDAPHAGLGAPQRGTA
jgi:membrane-associated phospholipid phosphatase